MSTPVLPPGYQENTNALPPGYQEVKPPINLNDPTQVAPVVGRAAVASLPAIGGIVGSILGGGVDPLTAGAGAGLGSVVSQELRNEFPKLFGNLDRDPTSFATQVGSDTLLNGVLPEVASNALAAPRQAIAKVLANKFVQKFPAVQEGMEGARLSALTKEGENLSGPDLSENINVNSILKKGVKNGRVTDPDAILAEMNKPDYEFTISPESKAAIEELAKHATPGASTGDRVLNYVKGRLALSAGGALVGHAMGGAAEGATAIYLTDATLGKLLSDPTTAKLTIAAMRTPTSAPTASVLRQILTNTVRGLEVPAQTKDQ